jgi:hypothetical protein
MATGSSDPQNVGNGNYLFQISKKIHHLFEKEQINKLMVFSLNLL